MIDKEKVIGGLELLAHWPDGLIITDKEKWIKPCCEMAIALLKEQEEQKKRWLQQIADNQLAVAPTGFETEKELARRTGEWNGLQMAWDILTNGR